MKTHRDLAKQDVLNILVANEYKSMTVDTLTSKLGFSAKRKDKSHNVVATAAWNHVRKLVDQLEGEGLVETNRWAHRLSAKAVSPEAKAERDAERAELEAQKVALEALCVELGLEEGYDRDVDHRGNLCQVRTDKLIEVLSLALAAKQAG